MNVGGKLDEVLSGIKWALTPNNATKYKTKEEAHDFLAQFKSILHCDELGLETLFKIRKFTFLYAGNLAGEEEWFTNDN
tara:strand:- start:261 stop:497 length:237 start_codon:yes stop_codon:yes gene_type:complete